MLQPCHKFVVMRKQVPKIRTPREPYPEAVLGSEGHEKPEMFFLIRTFFRLGSCKHEIFNVSVGIRVLKRVNSP